MLAKTPAAMKKRRARARLRNGKICLTIEVTEADFVEAVLRAQALSEAQALDRRQLAHVAGLVVKEWSARWL